MRLREIKQILEENVQYLNFEYTNKNEKYEIQNFPLLYKGIKKIEKLGFLNKEIYALSSMGNIFYDKSEKVILDGNGINSLTEIMNIIMIKVDAVLMAISEALPEQDQNSVSIKLPNYTELSEVYGFIKEIDMILNQTLVEEYKGTVKLQNFDTGSNWVEVIIDNKEAVLFLGGLVGCTVKFIQSSYLQWKQTKHTITMLNSDEAAKELILKSLDDTIKQQAQSHASALMKDFNIDESHQEYHTNLTHSIQKLAELMAKGTEVHTALNAPEETKQAFPDVTAAQALIENATKLLTDGSKGSSEE